MATFDARAPKVKVLVHRGDEWRVPIAVKVDGDPYDVSEYTFTAQIRTTSESTEVLPFEIDASDAVNGNLLLSISDANTVTDPEGDTFLGVYFWDLQADHPVVGIRTWVRGTWVVSADVTRDDV